MTTKRPMKIKLSSEGRARLAAQIHALFRDEFDRELSDFQLDRVLDFFIKHLGAPVYNQAIQDARSYLQEKVDDLEGEFYEPVADD